MIADAVTLDTCGIAIMRARMPENSRCPRIPMGIRNHFDPRKNGRLFVYLTPSEAFQLADVLCEYAREAMQTTGAIDHEDTHEGGDSSMGDTVELTRPHDPEAAAKAAAEDDARQQAAQAEQDAQQQEKQDDPPKGDPDPPTPPAPPTTPPATE